jgi:DnaJ family protein C protein 9
VKKAYRQLALRYHPDRTDIDQKEEAKTKFQIIGKVYAILSDDEKRKIYDDTGIRKTNILIFFLKSYIIFSRCDG